MGTRRRTLGMLLAGMLMAMSIPSAKGAEPTDSLPTLPADSVSVPQVDVVIGLEKGRGKITPVDNDRERPPQPTLHYYDRHGDPLPVPVLYLTEPADTVVSPRSPYPLYNGVDVGIDFLECIFRLCGQSYASAGLFAQVSLHNWFFPTLEAGIGWADRRYDNSLERYKAKPGPFLKLGFDYNFLYKSNPDYRAFVGFRAGYAHTNYQITGKSIVDPEGILKTGPDILGQKAHAFFGEVLFGIRVKIVGPFSMGWRARYRFMFSHSSGPDARPWFFPGYGGSRALSVEATLGFSFK